MKYVILYRSFQNLIINTLLSWLTFNHNIYLPIILNYNSILYRWYSKLNLFWYVIELPSDKFHTYTGWIRVVESAFYSMRK